MRGCKARKTTRASRSLDVGVLMWTRTVPEIFRRAKFEGGPTAHRPPLFRKVDSRPVKTAGIAILKLNAIGE
jgi:hypothetical protein